MRRGTLTNLFGADGLQRMGYEFADEAQEALHVRELRMGIEGSFINPLGVNKEGQRMARGLVEMDANATRLGARGLQNQ